MPAALLALVALALYYWWQQQQAASDAGTVDQNYTPPDQLSGTDAYPGGYTAADYGAGTAPAPTAPDVSTFDPGALLGTAQAEALMNQATGTARGIRNNNPGNIRYDGTQWQGLVSNDDKGFCVFSTAEYGIRALAINLLNQQTKHGLYTISQIISRYAPATENNTAAYIAAVSDQSGIPADAHLDLLANSDQIFSIVDAIITHENGSDPYSESQIDNGINLALAQVGSTGN